MSSNASAPNSAPRVALSADAWLEAVAEGSQLPEHPTVGFLNRGAFVGVGLQQAAEGDEAAPGEQRILRYVISSGTPSRRKILVNQAGIDTSRYHSVILWGHDWGNWTVPAPPIGKTVALTQDMLGGVTRTIATGQFAGLEHGYEDAEMYYRLAADGYIPDCSIGLDPTKYFIDEERGGLTVDQWELLEWSLVPIGDNVDAVKLAAAVQSYGLDWRPYVASVEALLDTLPAQRGEYISQTVTESFLKAMGLLGKVTFSGMLELGPQLFAARAQQPTAVASAPAAPPATAPEEAPVAEPITQAAEPIAAPESPVPPDEISRAEFVGVVRESLAATVLEITGQVVYLEN